MTDKLRLENRLIPAFVFMTLASFILTITSYFAPYWVGSAVKGVWFGLWFARKCQNSGCQDVWYMNNVDLRPAIGGWNTVRAFETLSVLSGFISLIFGICMYGVRHKHIATQHMLQGTFFATTLISGLTAIIGVLVFVTKESSLDRQWAPILAAIGGFLCCSSGILTLILCRFDPDYSPHKHSDLNVPDNTLTIGETSL